MPEYLKQRCCMCPNIKKPSDYICPGIDGTPHKKASFCRFVKVYKDERGWRYYVRSGISGKEFKAFYLRSDKKGNGHGCRQLPWRNNFDEAQADLNRLAEKKGWKEG